MNLRVSPELRIQPRANERGLCVSLSDWLKKGETLPPIPKPAKKNKVKMCKVCKLAFIAKPNQSCCSLVCAINKAMQDKLKIERGKNKKSLENLKSLRDHLNDTQKVFNEFIRLRDKNKPCISCNKPMMKKINAGHYRTIRAAPQLRFNEYNCHGQCEHCNSYQSGNIVEYRINLIPKIGNAQINRLEGNNEIHKYTIEEANNIKKEYKKRIKAMSSL